jgi:hypothetical protein
MKTLPDFLLHEHNPADPSPWLALYLDKSSPLADDIKQAWLADSASASRQFLMPVVRPLARACIVLFQLVKAVLPKRWQAPVFLHRMLAEGLKTWVSPQATWMILRHFHFGSDILAFIAANAGVRIPSRPLRPMELDDLKDNLFVQHDLNLFNFVIYLNRALQDEGRTLAPQPRLDLSMVNPCPVQLADMPHGRLNFIDLQTAIEIFTPMYQSTRWCPRAPCAPATGWCCTGCPPLHCMRRATPGRLTPGTTAAARERLPEPQAMRPAQRAVAGVEEQVGQLRLADQRHVAGRAGAGRSRTAPGWRRPRRERAAPRGARWPRSAPVQVAVVAVELGRAAMRTGRPPRSLV